MSIKSIALEKEFTSPYYQSNKEFCESIEKFILGKSGRVNGKYNSWAFTISGEFNSPINCKLKYKKSTMTAIDYYPATDEKYLVAHIASWEISLPNSRNYDLKIRKKIFVDVIKSAFIKPQLLKYSSLYVIISKYIDEKLLNILTEKLKPVFLAEEIFNLELKNGLLKIEMNTKKHQFELLEELVLLLS